MDGGQAGQNDGTMTKTKHVETYWNLFPFQLRAAAVAQGPSAASAHCCDASQTAKLCRSCWCVRECVRV